MFPWSWREIDEHALYCFFVRGWAAHPRAAHPGGPASYAVAIFPIDRAACVPFVSILTLLHISEDLTIYHFLRFLNTQHLEGPIKIQDT